MNGNTEKEPEINEERVQADDISLKIEEVNKEDEKEKRRKWLKDNKKWVFIGTGIILFAVFVFFRAGRKETELSNYLGMSKSKLEKIVNLGVSEHWDGYTLYRAQNGTLIFEIADNDQCVHLTASANADYKLFGIELGIGISDMRYELEQKGFVDQMLDYVYLFKRGTTSVVYDSNNGYVSEFAVADNKSLLLYEYLSDVEE